MVDTDSVRSKIENKIFINLGSTALWSSYTKGSNDKWGDRIDSYATTTSITIVPWTHKYKGEDFFEFGDLEAGDSDIALRYSQPLDINDKITWNTKVYKVKAIQYYTLKDALLVKVARIHETLSP
jgi:hypothetical protein